MKELYINKYYNNYTSEIIDSDFIFDYFLRNKKNNNFKVFKNIDYNEDHYYVESNPCKCYLCDSNIDYKKYESIMNYFINHHKNLLNSNILNKLKEYIELNKLFIYTSRIDISFYIHYHYHLCKTCFENSLYYWSLVESQGSPITENDGYIFIHHNDKFVPEVKSLANLNRIKKIKFGNMYHCKYNQINITK